MKNKVQMEQAAVKRKKVIVPFLIGLLLLSSIVFIKHLMNRMNSYIEKNGKMSMGAVVEQMQQTYELQTNGYYSQLHLVEGYLLQKKELSLETEENRIFFDAWERESQPNKHRFVFLHDSRQPVLQYYVRSLNPTEAYLEYQSAFSFRLQ